MLFVCTGNYYRSRTAEELFNYWAGQKSMDWIADSRGLREDMSQSPNVGPISRFAVDFLTQKEIPILGLDRMPRSLIEEDFALFDRILCMDEQEHRPMMQARFSAYENVVEYWEVRDVQFESSRVALPLLFQNVEQLVQELEGTMRSCL
ncbi:MAG: low molecular weight phosphatase family protein [Bacteroidota bacterium]